MAMLSILSGYLADHWPVLVVSGWFYLAFSVGKSFFLYILTAFLVFINARSAPMVWHGRVFLPLGIMRIKYHILSYQHALSLQPAAARHSKVVIRLESFCPVGANPFELVVQYSSWAGPDDTDWMGHLSNSSYAKVRDAALSRFSVTAFPTFISAGGWVIPASTYYHFLREIPLFASYEVRLSIGAWDQKWMYLVCRFVSFSKSKPKPKMNQDTLPKALPSSSGAPTPPVYSDSKSTNISGEEVTKALAASLLAEDSDGTTTMHCFSISRVCFKIGRITVPPALLLACEGFSKPPSSGSYSHDAPPPHWIHPHSIRNSSGSLNEYRRFLTGSWRDVPDEKRWWIEPLSGPIEEQRREKLTKLDSIYNGMNGCVDL
ncbi:hypothetical protein BU15DRAFT_78001 [Melanogaster broomeanus]|nr:hypothetical protein BU15DRAFT_78001 [Melanogaster broomeanus]